MQNKDTSSQPELTSPAGLSRRELLLGLGAAATVAAAPAFAAMPGHDHSKHSTQQPDMLDAANACVDKGERCIAHCLVSFQEGDLQLADCAAKVHEMRAICEAFSYLLAANSSYVRDYAPVCARVCEDCEKECRKHEEHIECKACAEACADLVDQIKLVFDKA
jgi:Cys-rich four helix bundle protein (predicted Tat secretion target)